MIEKDGLIALQHYNTNPRTVRVESDGTLYTFVPKHNVCMCWVRAEHVPLLLAKKATVCCGKTKQMFLYASQINVNLWETGIREGV